MMKAKFSILMTLLLMLACAACDGSDDDDDSSTDDDAQADYDSDTDDDNEGDDENISDDDNGTGDDDNIADDDDSDDDDSLDDDTQGDDDTAPHEIPECLPDRNTYPDLISVNLIVNGEIVEQPYTATTNDEISISFEYYDAECNLEFIPDQPFGIYHGRFSIWLDYRDEENLSEEAYDQLSFHTWNLPGIGCSSEESGPYVIELDPQDWVVDETEIREYPFWVRLFDSCNYADESTIDFTVHAAK